MWDRICGAYTGGAYKKEGRMWFPGRRNSEWHEKKLPVKPKQEYSFSLDSSVFPPPTKVVQPMSMWKHVVKMKIIMKTLSKFQLTRRNFEEIWGRHECPNILMWTSILYLWYGNQTVDHDTEPSEIYSIRCVLLACKKSVLVFYAYHLLSAEPFVGV